jgi:hypothetical protein
MTSITMSKRHRQPVSDADMARQSSVFPPEPETTAERPARKPVMTLHLPRRRGTAGTDPQDSAQASLLDGEPQA